MTTDESGELLFEASPIAILKVNRAGHVVDCNRAACVGLSRSRGELVGAPVLRWLVPEDRGRSKAYFLKAFQGGLVEWRARFLRGDGVPRTMDVRAVLPRRDAEQESLRVFLRETVSDWSGRPESAQVQHVLESLPGQFVLVLDERGRIRRSTGVARALWYEDEICLGRKLTFLLANGDGDRGFLDQLRGNVAAGRVWNGIVWFSRADGSRLPAQVHVSPYSDPRIEKVVGLLLVGRDVGREHELNAALREAERFARIGEQVASVALELRVPLDEVEQRLREMRGRDAKLDDGELVGAVDRLGRLVDSLLAYSAPPEPDRGSIDTRDLLEALLADFERGLPDGIELSVSLADDLPSLPLNEKHLRQIVRAPLVNAREALASRDQGRIRVEVEADEDRVTFRVLDDGAGITEEWFEQIFDPFFTTKSGHLGLGLTTARGLVEAYGGRIRASRVGNRWTGLHLELPTDPGRVGSAFRPIPLVLRRARTVLIVDDDQAVRTLVRKFLEKVGYRVAEAWSGRSALAQLASGEPPDLVVSDLKMADGTGYWFLRELSKDFPETLKRTIILTGDPSESTVDQLREETGCPVVRKPFDLHELLEVLDEVVLRE